MGQYADLLEKQHIQKGKIIQHYKRATTKKVTTVLQFIYFSARKEAGSTPPSGQWSIAIAMVNSQFSLLMKIS